MSEEELSRKSSAPPHDDTDTSVEEAVLNAIEASLLPAVSPRKVPPLGGIPLLEVLEQVLPMSASSSMEDMTPRTQLSRTFIPATPRTIEDNEDTRYSTREILEYTWEKYDDYETYKRRIFSAAIQQQVFHLHDYGKMEIVLMEQGADLTQQLIHYQLTLSESSMRAVETAWRTIVGQKTIVLNVYQTIIWSDPVASCRFKVLLPEWMDDYVQRISGSVIVQFYDDIAKCSHIVELTANLTCGWTTGGLLTKFLGRTYDVAIFQRITAAMLSLLMNTLHNSDSTMADCFTAKPKAD